MPRHSKRVAARQAALSRKKRPKAGPQAPVAPPLSAAATQVVAQDAAPVSAAVPPEAGAPEVAPRAEAPSASQARPVPRRPQPSAPASAAPSRRALPSLPYMKSDLIAIGWVSLGILVVLVALGLLLQ